LLTWRSKPPSAAKAAPPRPRGLPPPDWPLLTKRLRRIQRERPDLFDLVELLVSLLAARRPPPLGFQPGGKRARAAG
jgi:hypothetical protein